MFWHYSEQNIAEQMCLGVFLHSTGSEQAGDEAPVDNPDILLHDLDFSVNLECFNEQPGKNKI
ncbi:hypothetical protein NT017_33700 [Prolixibacter sp. NT017]|nr:hypothetical protein NT017_33700 [Prolixibacter sp. NT017]